MGQEQRPRLERRVEAAAEQELARRKFVAPVQLLAALGWLPGRQIDRWQQGRIDCLERVGTVPPDKLAKALGYFRAWATRRGLVPAEVAYVAATRDRRALRFTVAGDAAVEAAWRTHWTARELSDAARARQTERASRAPDLVAIQRRGPWQCGGCGGGGGWALMEDGAPLCMVCVDMDHLVFLPSGDATLTRRAKAASKLSAVAVRRSRSRGRSRVYERIGILVEEGALEAAEQACLADEEVRVRRRERDRERRENQDLVLQARTAEEIVRRYPGCPPDRAEAIARHTGSRGSGRVGRSWAGRALDPEAIRMAVVASIRHEDTRYDRLLMSGVPRMVAREKVRAEIDRVLDRWRRG